MITKEKLKQHDRNNTGVILTILSLYGIPEKMIDIGSGSGVMVDIARKLGANAIGIDLLAEEPDIKANLNTEIPIISGFGADMIITIETAEHIQNESNFLRVINAHTKEGTILIFTAAVPGQKGDGHVNCRPKDYWRKKLEGMGYIYNQEHTSLVSEWWRYSGGGLSAWISPNLQIFRRGPK